MSALARVPFRGGHLLAAQLEGEVWVPLLPVCEALGVSPQGQLAKLRAKPWATIKIILSVAGDGKARQLAAVDLRSLPLWLATIEPSRVKPEAREALVAYQREAAEVLYRHFLAPGREVSSSTERLGGQVAQLAAEVDVLRQRLAGVGRALLGSPASPAPAPTPAPCGLHDPLVVAFLETLQPGARFRMTYPQLLAALTARVGEIPTDWPTHGKALQCRLKRNLATLRAAGVNLKVAAEGHAKTKVLHISRS